MKKIIFLILFFATGMVAGKDANKELNRSSPCETDYNSGYETGWLHGQQLVFGYPTHSFLDADEEQEWNTTLIAIFNYVSMNLSCEDVDCFSERTSRTSLSNFKNEGKEKFNDFLSDSQCETSYDLGYRTGFKTAHQLLLNGIFEMELCRDWNCFRLDMFNLLSEAMRCQNIDCFFEKSFYSRNEQP